MKKPFIRSFDFIRVLSTLGIVVYHLCCHLPDRSFLPLYAYANGDWGGALVTVFFMLSGASLYYHYAGGEQGRIQLKTYYYRRWKSIFPMYYLAYAAVEIKWIIQYRALFFRGNPVHYFWTLLGMDGYLSQVLVTHYTLGEWFTGAIVILYILFPLLLWCMERTPTLTGLSALLLYAFTLHVPIINPVAYWSIPSCLISFACGMLLMRLRPLLQSRLSVTVSTLALFVLCLTRLPFSHNVGNHVTGMLLFIVLDAVGSLVMTKRLPNALFTRLSSISYGVFLMHHVVLVEMLNHWNPSGAVQVLAFLLCALLVIGLLSVMLTFLTRELMKRIEPFLLQKLGIAK